MALHKLLSALVFITSCKGSPSCPTPLEKGQTLAVTQNSVHLTDMVRGRAVPVIVWRPKASQGPFPLVSLGHGASMSASGYVYLGSALAARGYVVVGFDEYETKGTQLDYMLDIAAVRDSMYNASANTSSPFHGLLCDKAVAVGHSLGGGCEFVAADHAVMKDCGNSEPNATQIPCAGGGYTADFAGLAALSGGFVFDSDPFAPHPKGTPDPYLSAGRLSIPALLVSGTSDCVVTAMGEDYPAYAAMTRSTCRVFVNVTGADHCQWAGLGALEQAGCVLMEKLKGCKPGISAKEQQAIAVDYVSTWFDFVAKGDTASQAQLFNKFDSDRSEGKATWEHVCGSASEGLIV